MSVIKGYTVDEVAKSKADNVRLIYQECEELQTKINEAKLRIEILKERYDKAITNYRIESVNRVLDFIRFAKVTDAHELDLLLCHCQNKLNGNIDGTEIELTKAKYVKENENDYTI